MTETGNCEREEGNWERGGKHKHFGNSEFLFLGELAGSWQKASLPLSMLSGVIREKRVLYSLKNLENLTGEYV